ncbi:MAG TPA: hypothetical protein VFN67_37090 [Polyangiales bacterium]|nr:hypothetical protein [Polyangiales bacterium]
MVRALVLLSMLLATSASTYFLMREHAARPSVLKRFQKLARDPLLEQRPEWRPRVASIVLVQRMLPSEKDAAAAAIALLFAAGTLLAGIFYILTSPRAAPVMLLGTFAALVYCNTPRAEDTWYPWDIPALVLSAACLWLAVRRFTPALALLAVAAVPFKETVLLMAGLIMFFDDQPLRKRIAWTVGALIAGVCVRVGIEAWIGQAVDHARFLHVHGKSERPLRLMDNLHYVFDTNLNHVLWANAGLWATVFIIPSRDRVLSGFRWIALLIYAGLLFAGSFNEFRVFLEALPGSLLLVSNLFDSQKAGSRLRT